MGGACISEPYLISINLNPHDFAQGNLGALYPPMNMIPHITWWHVRGTKLGWLRGDDDERMMCQRVLDWC